MKAIVAIKSLKENLYFHAKASELFNDVEYTEKRPTVDEMPSFLSGCDIAIIGAREKVNKSILEKATSTPKVIGTLSVGLDHIDIEETNRRGIQVINAPTANVLSVAEHVMAFALALSKRLKESDLAVQTGQGRLGVKTSPIELKGKTMGLIGYGKIAKQISILASCFGMKIIATSKTKRQGIIGNVTFGTLDYILTNANVISINVPLVDSTKKMICEESLKAIKQSPILINTSRPEIVDHIAILNCIENGKLSGYAEDADAIPEYLSKRENVICSPHLAGLTIEASNRLDNELIDNIEVYLQAQDN